MTRFADTHTQLVDTERVTKIRKDEADRFAAPFVSLKAKAAANARSFSAKRTFALA
jgi:hypothetical protein